MGMATVAVGDNSQFSSVQGQDLHSILEWIKTNETVNKMMQKAKV